MPHIHAPNQQLIDFIANQYSNLIEIRSLKVALEGRATFLIRQMCIKKLFKGALSRQARGVKIGFVYSQGADCAKGAIHAQGHRPH